MDTASIIIIVSLIVGVVSLLIERAFTWAARIKKSDCMGSHIELNNSGSVQNLKKEASVPTADKSAITNDAIQKVAEFIVKHNSKSEITPV